MQKGYDQILWLFGPEGEERLTEVGAMNVFVVVDRDDGGASFSSAYELFRIMDDD